MTTRHKNRPTTVCEFCDQRFVVIKDRFNAGRAGIMWRTATHTDLWGKRCTGSRIQVPDTAITLPEETE